MTKRGKKICVICVIVVIIFVNMPQRPKIISSITTLDTAYLTILVDKSETGNIKKLEEKLLQMCKEDSFENIKLQTEDKPLEKKLHISVYTSNYALKKGIPYLIIEKDAED